MKKALICILILILTASLACLVACKDRYVDVAFVKTEYELNDGDKASVSGSDKGVTFKLLTPQDGVSVDENSGRFTIDPSVADYSQVVVAAQKDGKVVSTAICCLRTPTPAPAITFSNLSNYIVNGDSVNAVSTPSYSISYSLRQDYAGISIDGVNGKVTFSGSVADGQNFTVVASAKGVSSEKTFTTAVGNYVLVNNAEAKAEYRVGNDVTFALDYQNNPEAEQAGVLAVMNGHSRLDGNDWSYDKDKRELTVKAEYTSNLSMGDNQLKIVTAKNAVTVNVNVAKFVATAAELAAINESVEALAGHYIMVCDIDLSEYLGVNGEGYNNGKGWTPIGTYYDTHFGAETEWAFTGTFDGNGHTVSGFFINRADDYAYNSGFFGYIASQATVKNLGVRNGEGQVNNVRSYSGGFAGVNVGKITDCWADVNVITGEIFKVIGGFVGRNEGEITNCYSLGRVSGGSEVGSFAGVSRTPISVGKQTSCYAVKTENYPFSNDFNETCKVVSNKSEMAECDFSSYSTAWNLSAGALPTLKSVELDYDLRELFVTADNDYVTRGETLQLNVITNPAKQELANQITYTVLEGRGVRVSAEGLVNTSQVQRPTEGGAIHCVIRVSCAELSAIFEFNIYDQIDEVIFADTMEKTMYAGNSYKIDAQVLPLTANPELTYRLTKNHKGVTIDGDVISVSNYVSDGDVTVLVTAKDGKRVSLNIAIVGNKTFDGNYKIIYRDSIDASVRFTLPQGVAETVTKVTMFDKKIDYTVGGSDVILSKSLLTVFGEREIPLKFITDDGIYMATAVAYDSETNVIKIGSVQDFLNYKADFMDDTRPAGERKFTDEELAAFRGKTVCLTADLDFMDMDTDKPLTLTSIGSHHMGADFTGIFNGNGFTIKNLNIDKNEFTGKYVGEGGVEHPDETEYPYHASRYNVGLFSYVSGSVVNVNFENITVASRFTGDYNRNGQIIHYTNEPFGNSVGVVAGTVSGTVSNCTFTNCKVYAGGDLKGIICGKQTSVVVTNCHIDGELYEK